jgi:hypothetical protein
MLVTRKPRKGKKKHRILWSDETLRDQLWWLKPQKRVKREVKGEPVGGVANTNQTTVLPLSASSSLSSTSSSSASAAPRPQLEVLVKIEPGAEDEVGKTQ